MLSMLIWVTIITPLFRCVVMVTGEDGQPADLTCFTCAKTSSNLLCNKYAVDRPCSTDNGFCQTIHVMEPDGISKSVAKRCVTQYECLSTSVGCISMDAEGSQTCVSCCDESYCNEFAPTNSSTAIYSQTRGRGGPSPRAQGTQLWVILMGLLILMACTIERSKT